MIKDLRLIYEGIGNNVFKCDRNTMEYILKDNCNLRAISEFLLNEDEDYDREVDSKLCYERVVHAYSKKEDRIRGINYNLNGGLYFDEGSLEYDGEFYIFDIVHGNHEGGVYCTSFEDDVKYT